jgi:diphthine synthase
LLKTDVCIGVARIGGPTQKIVTAPLEQFPTLDLGPPLHSLVICGKMHPLEVEFIEEFRNKESS